MPESFRIASRCSPLFDELAKDENSALIEICWGTVPRFTFCEVLHLRTSINAKGDGTVLLTALLFADNGSDPDGHQEWLAFKPSRIEVEFSGVTILEYVGSSGAHPVHGIKLDPIFIHPPIDAQVIEIEFGFYVACKEMSVLSCSINQKD